MSRYIDADVLKNKITELDGGCAVDGTGFDIYTCEVFELIDEVPAADVVHGEWIDTNPSEPLDPRMTCSICGNTEVLHSGNFCPNCGAKMERGERCLN